MALHRWQRPAELFFHPPPGSSGRRTITARSDSEKRTKQIAPQKGKAAFTLIEALLAMLIVTLAVAVSATTLLTLHRAERALDIGAETLRVATALQTELYLHGTVTNSEIRHSDRWLFAAADLPDGGPSVGGRWRVWEIAPRERPSAAFRLPVLEPLTGD